ncbi:hypothetical protein Y032_0039g80 [Ancylostoma ceylanicum]|nr:hypothetical protein Y032_0039g80 [Ancylostoma ceylanicum]
MVGTGTRPSLDNVCQPPSTGWLTLEDALDHVMLAAGTQRVRPPPVPLARPPPRCFRRRWAARIERNAAAPSRARPQNQRARRVQPPASLSTRHPLTYRYFPNDNKMTLLHNGFPISVIEKLNSKFSDLLLCAGD